MLASLTFGACGNDDDEQESDFYTVTTVNATPTWQVDWTYNDGRPDWQDPSTLTYENWSIVKVQIEEDLQPMASANDLMAIFVGNEVRGVTGPAIIVGSNETDTSTYLLKAWGNENDGQQIIVTLKYYNNRLKHIFSRTASFVYHVGEELGVSKDFIPNFTLGSSKYPVVMSFDATTLIAKAGIRPAVGDIIAAFVGDECRGTSQTDNLSIPMLTIFGREVGESITLQYYQATTGRILTFHNVTTTEQQQTTGITIQ